ncbi:MAG: hypothetical protein AAF740_06915 [Bacteroidota bacterium]
MWIRFLAIAFIFSACEQQLASRKPFEVNNKVTCKDLVEQGYRWVSGEDVVLFGRRSGDTLDYYQIEYNDELFCNDNSDYLPERRAEEDSVFGITFNEVFEEDCKCTSTNWRYFSILIKPEDSLNLEKHLESDSLVIVQEEENPDYYLTKAVVLNLATNDTFFTSIDEREGKYYFSTSVTFR